LNHRIGGGDECLADERKNLLFAVIIGTTTTVTTTRGLIRITVTAAAATRGLVIITTTVTAESRAVVGRAVGRGLVIITTVASVTAAEGGFVGVVTVSVTAAALGRLVLIITVLIRARALGRGLVGTGRGLSTVRPAVSATTTTLGGLILIVAVLSRLGGLMLGLAVVLGLAVLLATVGATVAGGRAGGSLAAGAVARGVRGGLITRAVAGGRAGRRLVTGTVAGAGTSRAGAVAGTAALRKGSSVDTAAGRDVRVVIALDVTRRPVLADEHVVAVHSAPNLGGALPHTLRVVTRAFGEATGVIGALVEPLAKDHIPRVAVAVVRKILTVVAAGVLHVAADMVSPASSRSRELIVPLESADTIGTTTVVVGLEALRLKVVGDGAGVTGVARAATTTVALHRTLDLLEERVGRGAGSEESESDSRTHID